MASSQLMILCFQVDIEHINYEEFYQFLNELFSTGISRERIVVLLFFCSDIVVRAYNNPLANFKRLFNWFLEYIIDKVCDWVKDHGGWVCYHCSLVVII